VRRTRLSQASSALNKGLRSAISKETYPGSAQAPHPYKFIRWERDASREMPRLMSAGTRRDVTSA
jgi:hypothetical protein